MRLGFQALRAITAHADAYRKNPTDGPPASFILRRDPYSYIAL